MKRKLKPQISEASTAASEEAPNAEGSPAAADAEHTQTEAAGNAQRSKEKEAIFAGKPAVDDELQWQQGDAEEPHNQRKENGTWQAKAAALSTGEKRLLSEYLTGGLDQTPTREVMDIIMLLQAGDDPA